MTVTWIDTPGSTLASTADAIDFEVTDPLTTIDVALAVEPAYREGAFVAPYLESTRDGNVIALRRTGGWIDPPTVFVDELTIVEVEVPGPPVAEPVFRPVLLSVLDADPSYGSNTILLHGNGTNGSTSIRDQMGNLWTASGNAQISTTGPKYGNASMAFDGAGDFLSAAVPQAVGTANFTIEAWIYITSLTTDREVFCIGSTTSATSFDVVFEVKTNGAIRGSLQNGAGTSNVDITSAAGAITINTWHHVAFTGEGTTARVRVNGAVTATGTITGARSQGRTDCRLGFLCTDFSGTVVRYFAGRIDDLRVTKGVCRYPGAGAITPPSAQLPSCPVPLVVSTFGTPTSADAQGVATDGVHVWYTSSTTIYKYTVGGVFVTSRNVAADAPASKNQINGIHHRNGVLYVSAALFSVVGTSWVVEYDPTTLAYITHHVIPGNHFSEGITYRDGFWWMTFHADMLVGQYDSAWNQVALHTLPGTVTGSSGGYGAGTGYDGQVWVGNYLYCNIHEIYNQDAMHVYAWNGYTFLFVCSQTRCALYASQGLCLDPNDPTIAWLALRNLVATDGVARASLT